MTSNASTVIYTLRGPGWRRKTLARKKKGEEMRASVPRMKRLQAGLITVAHLRTWAVRVDPE